MKVCHLQRQLRSSSVSRIASLLLGATLVGAGGPVTAQEWTRFRGPNGSGESSCTTIPITWTENEYNWKVSLPGIGHSSPVVWDEKIFLLSGDSEDATRYVLCLNAATGKPLWINKYPSPPHRIHSRNSFASSTPAVDADQVYVVWATPEETILMALDHGGHIKWTVDLGPFSSKHGFGTSPVLYKDLVILALTQEDTSAESAVIAVDRASGETRWRLPRNTSSVSYSTPCLRQLEGGLAEVICCSDMYGIMGLDAETGRENWSIDVFERRTVSSPILSAGLVFGTNGSGGGGIYLAAVRPGESPELAYKITTQAPYVPSLVARGELVFMWSEKGIVTCIRAPDGSVVWQKRVGGNFSGSPVRAGDRLYCIEERGQVVVLAAEEKFRELARNPLGEPSRSTPTVAGSRMLLRTYSHLISVGK